MRSIRLWMTTCLLVLALLLAGCGGGDDGDGSDEPAEPLAAETTQTSTTTSTTMPIPKTLWPSVNCRSLGSSSEMAVS